MSCIVPHKTSANLPCKLMKSSNIKVLEGFRKCDCSKMHVLCHRVCEHTLVSALASITILWKIRTALTLCRIKSTEDGTSTSNMISPVVCWSWHGTHSKPSYWWKIEVHHDHPPPHTHTQTSASLYSLPILLKEAFDFVSKVFSSSIPKMKDLWDSWTTQSSLCKGIGYGFSWKIRLHSHCKASFEP